MKLLIAFFLKYLLAPLLIVLLLFLISTIKKGEKKIGVKNVIVYILLAGLLLGIPGFLGVLQDEYVWGGLLINMGMYLIYGSLFLKTMVGGIAERIQVDESRWAQILIMVASGVLGGWLHYLVFEWQGGMPYGHWAMGNILWYTIPYLVYICLKLFHGIPPALYDLWYVGQSSFSRAYWDNFDNFSTLMVKVKIKRKRGDRDFSAFTVRLQDGITLGDWFNWMVEDQNKRSPGLTIDVEDEGAEIGWLFYTAKWINYPLFIKVLDPKQDSKANGIRKNQTIYIKRVIVVNNRQYEED